MTIIQVSSVAPMALGASHRARRAPVHRRRRRRFHLRLKPRKDIAERERAESIAVARVLPWAASDVLTANRRTWAKVG
jgi:hypothetical protein